MAYPYYGYQYYQPPMADQLTQLRQTQYQPVQPPQQHQSPIIWVQGEEAAKAYMVAPGNSVLLMDSEGSTFYLKSSDAQGMPMPLRIFDYTERTEQRPAQAQMPQAEEFVTRAEFEALEARLEAMAAPRQPAKKVTQKEETSHE